MQTQQPFLTLERFPAPADTDSATRDTVALMCRYISESAADPYVQQCAAWVRDRYAAGSDAASIAWGVFWFVKHFCKFVIDESPMFRIEQRVPGMGYAQQDLLIAPNVLLRMEKPQGDCDDFTMLVCCLLKCLGVPFVIVTIAASAEDPERWSHVFAMALCPNPVPLDASHGVGPGWIVPAANTFRWQAWDEQANPVSIPRPRGRGLHGWVRTGLGQDDSGVTLSFPSTTGTVSDQTVSFPEAPLPTPASVVATPVLTGADILSLPAAPSSTSTGFNWTSFLNNLTSQAAGVAKVAEVSGATTNASLAASGVLQSLLPWLILLIVGGVVISTMEKR